jgi:Gas vesicle synthesis protein GvpO
MEMTERRKARSGTGSRTSARRRNPSSRDEEEILDQEPSDPETDELLYEDEPEEVDDEMADADEPEAAEVDEEDVDEEDEEFEPAGNGRRRPARRSDSDLTAGQAAKAALRQIAELTAKQPEGVTGVERMDDGWVVGIELLEDQRIPSSADILATYETTIDADGELLSYRRVKRYARGRGDTEEA